MILRRLYLYLVSAAALVLLAVGLSILGTTVLLFVFNDTSADAARGTLAVSSAMSIVAFPVWAIHFGFAQRFATRDPYERSSAIRHLYLYFACLAFSIAAMVAISQALTPVLRPVFDTTSLNGLWAGQSAWLSAVFLTIWAFHFYVAYRDRKAVPEEGASATLRRWYMYIALIVGLFTMLGSTQVLLDQAWTLLATNAPLQTGDLASPAASLIAGALLWGFHARVIALQHIADDRHSTLRALEGFIAIAISIVIALTGASQILYYALARILGVNSPGGASNDIVTAAAGPVSMVLVFGVAWFLLSRRLARDAGTQEADRQAGVRRLYTNLVSLISLAAWAYGAALLLGTLGSLLEAPIIGVASPDWKNPISLSLTLFAVGAAVWVAHWRPSPWAADRQSFSRKLYVWAALLGSVLAVLGAGVNLVYVLLRQVFSATPTLNDTANLSFATSLAVILVAAAVGVYHWRVLRADAAARPPKPDPAPTPKVAVIAAPAAAEKPAAVAEVLGPHSRRYALVVTDATDDDVHQALAGLPPQASYKLTPAEHPVDGR